MPTITRYRTVDAPLDVVWDVITDHDLYAEVAPNLSTVDVLEGNGVGLVRRCVDTIGNQWTETCTHWAPGSRFTVTVDVDSSDFHRRLFTRFDGTWALHETPDGVTITVRFTFDPRYGPVDKLISWYLSRRADSILGTLFDNWETAIENRVETPTTRYESTPRSHTQCTR